MLIFLNKNKNLINFFEYLNFIYIVGKLKGIYIMKLWEILFAGDLLYQDLGDCSLCCMPVAPELDIHMQNSDMADKTERESKAA